MEAEWGFVGHTLGMDDQSSQVGIVPQWYTRREGVERGPFTESEVSRYILLGRIRLADELRCHDQAWQAAADCEALVPEEMKLPPSPENEQRLQRARMAADERRGGDRRAENPDPSADILERRSGIERRRAQPDEVTRFRQPQRAALDFDAVLSSRSYTLHHRIVIGVALLLGVLLLLWGTSSAWS